MKRPLKQTGVAFREGSRLPQDKAEATYAALEKLREKHGTVKAPVVVDAARPERSPLHWAFDWDDTAAAEKYRFWQARNLVSALVVEYDHDGGEGRAPAFANLTIVSEPDEDGETESERGYHGIVQAMGDQSLRAALLDQAKRELAAFRARYAVLAELAEIFAAMDRLAS